MTSYRPQIVIAATAHGIDPDLVEAVVEQESSGKFYAYRYEPGFYTRYLAHNPDYTDRNPYEVSASFGLMQCMYPTALEHGFVGDPWDLFNPRKNLDIGCTILAKLLTWARSQYTGLSAHAETAIRRSALAAYNGGKNGNSPNSTVMRNQQYALAVLARYDRIRKAPSA